MAQIVIIIIIQLKSFSRNFVFIVDDRLIICLPMTPDIVFFFENDSQTTNSHHPNKWWVPGTLSGT